MTETIVYFIRHSEKIDLNLIDNTYNDEYYQNRREKIVLSIEGEEKAKRLSEENEFQNIDTIYSSNYVRTIQTAKYMAEPKKKIINIDKRFNERNIGIVDKERNIVIKQYFDENLKNKEGESQKEVRDRMYKAFMNVVCNNKGKKVVVFSHGAAITFLLMKWCKLEYIKEDKHKCLSFNNKIIVDKVFEQPEVFKITVGENNEILNIENIEI